MELAGDEVRMLRLRELHDLDELAVGGESAYIKPLGFQFLARRAVVGELVAVAMPFGDNTCGVVLFDRIYRINRIGSRDGPLR